MAKILDAVIHCHKNEVLHRDIKDENILLSKKQVEDPKSPFEAKLIDFGCGTRLKVTFFLFTTANYYIKAYQALKTSLRTPIIPSLPVHLSFIHPNGSGSDDITENEHQSGRWESYSIR